MLYDKSISVSIADVNGDNVVNVQDLLLLKEYVLGKIFLFPVQISKLQALVDEINSTRDVEIQMTPEMLSKTEELGTPEAVYEYVKNNVNYEFYYGSKKGAIGTFEEMSGNDIDQASLLISMLSYFGCNAQYELINMRITYDQAMQWTSTNNIQSALNLLNSQYQLEVSSTNELLTISNRVIVKIFDSDNPETYELIDPSFKYYTENDSAYDYIEDYESYLNELNEATIFNDIDYFS